MILVLNSVISMLLTDIYIYIALCIFFFSLVKIILDCCRYCSYWYLDFGVNDNCTVMFFYRLMVQEKTKLAKDLMYQ